MSAVSGRSEACDWTLDHFDGRNAYSVMNLKFCTLFIGLGTLLLAQTKRQFQKTVYRGKPDLIPGKWFLKKHMRDKTTFSSNIGLDKL
jgi:hypothetical protein